jgi:glycerol-3-phosphate cytidylyltransferase
MNNRNGIVGFTCGAFDLLHPGHLHFLLECKTQCNKLIVGLHTDPTIDRPDAKNKPIQTSFERWFQLHMLGFIDTIIPYDTEQDLINLLGVSSIDKRFIGSDYKDKKITGDLICNDRNIEIVYIPRSHNWSSSELRRRIK